LQNTHHQPGLLSGGAILVKTRGAKLRRAPIVAYPRVMCQ
jgi:hypothetical protein